MSVWLCPLVFTPYFYFTLLFSLFSLYVLLPMCARGRRGTSSSPALSTPFQQTRASVAHQLIVLQCMWTGSPAILRQVILLSIVVVKPRPCARLSFNLLLVSTALNWFFSFLFKPANSSPACPAKLLLSSTSSVTFTCLPRHTLSASTISCMPALIILLWFSLPSHPACSISKDSSHPNPTTWVFTITPFLNHCQPDCACSGFARNFIYFQQPTPTQWFCLYLLSEITVCFLWELLLCINNFHWIANQKPPCHQRHNVSKKPEPIIHLTVH